MDTLVDTSVGGRYIKSRVTGEEVAWLHGETARLDRHDREILNADQVSDAKCEPHNNISIDDRLSFLGPVGQTILAIGLIAVKTSSKHFIILIRSDLKK